MQKIYCRSKRPDGYWEGVVPLRNRPKYTSHDYPPGSGVGRQWDEWQNEWCDELKQLPLYALIHPDLAKVGWVGECSKRYEVLNDVGKWVAVDESWYSCMKEHLRRIVLVPVEGKEESRMVANLKEELKSTPPEEIDKMFADKAEEKETTQCPELGKALKGLSSAIESAQSKLVEEKEVDRYAHLKKRMREYFDNVTPEELVAKFEAMGYTFVELSKPSTQPAEEKEVVSKRSWEAAIDYCNDMGHVNEKDMRSNFMSFMAGVKWERENPELPKPSPALTGEIGSDIEMVVSLDRLFRKYEAPKTLHIEVIKLIEKYYKAASRTSDAVEVLEWLLDVNLNGVGGNQFHKIIMIDGDFYWETDNDGDQPLDGKDLYKIFKQQTTKP